MTQTAPNGVPYHGTLCEEVLPIDPQPSTPDVAEADLQRIGATDDPDAVPEPDEPPEANGPRYSEWLHDPEQRRRRDALNRRRARAWAAWLDAVGGPAALAAWTPAP